MCGIAGAFFFKEGPGSSRTQSEVSDLLDAIAHRGPDDRGVAAFDRFAMGMVRLSIIDLSGGNQPIQDSSGRYSIVFNGEIYNYKRLRSELVSQGAEFRTHSDTEVVLQGLLKKGTAYLSELEGMFAFALYDSKNHELLLCRDRLGKKPLYYYQDEDRLVFCSETRALRKDRALSLSIDPQSYWDYLTFRYVPGENSIFNGVLKLPSAHFARVGAQGIRLERYWNFPSASEVIPGRAQSELDRDFGQLFAEAVEKRLVADVPVGVVLSGGLDSCAVLYEAARNRKIDSYHVFFRTDLENYNELKYAKTAAEHLGSKLSVVEVTEDQFIANIGKLHAITDEPISDLSAVPYKAVCDLAASEIKVVLSGEGSDEVLAGYGLQATYQRLRLLKLIQANPFLKRLASVTLRSLPGKAHLARFVDVPVQDWGRASRFNITFQIDQDAKKSLTFKNSASYLDSARFLDAHYASAAQRDELNQLLYVISKDWLVDDVLMKSDKVSMSSSLEVRSPFLDHRLVEFMFKVSGSQKVGFLNGKFRSKVLLRRYMKGKLPDEILYRKKLGFPVPAYLLQAQVYRDFVLEALNSSSAFYGSILDKSRVLELYDRALREPPEMESHTKHLLWTIANFEHWYRESQAQR